ncbi:MAG: hypothetical protein HQ567_28670, partial [Candidatus Nealsonbacteria bacterium]|nr:hypothetical protein [Candidatus Nealsonbacteria bacterium]
ATAMMIINCETLLGDRMPRGVRRAAWNVGLALAVAASTALSLLLIWLKTGNVSNKAIGNEFGGLMLAGALVVVMLAVHFVAPRKPTTI